MRGGIAFNHFPPRDLFYVRLLRAAQVPVVVDNLAFAFLEVIQVGGAPVAALGGTASFQIIALHPDFLAGLRVRTNRRASQGGANRRGHAAQRAILVQDLAVAFSVIMKTGVLPVAIAVLAA